MHSKESATDQKQENLTVNWSTELILCGKSRMGCMVGFFRIMLKKKKGRHFGGECCVGMICVGNCH